MKLAFLLFLFLTCHALTTAQKVAPSPTEKRSDDVEDVVRISTNLIQIDAVVTDKKGQPITDLTAADFELRQDGRLQTISNLSLVSVDAPRDDQSDEKQINSREAGAPVRLKREDVRRTVALVLDDLCLSFESMVYARRAMRKFVNEDIQPGDLVAIVRTAGSIGLLQQFTGDKKQLLAAIDHIRWSPRKCNRREDMNELNETLRLPQSGLSDGRAQLTKDGAWAEGLKNPESDVEKAAVTVGTLGALAHVVRGLNRLPGRKAVHFISDGFRIVDHDDPRHTARVLEAVRRVADVAARSSVTIYTLNARGLVTTNLTAADQVSASQISRSPQIVVARVNQVNDSQAGLHYLAQQAAGFAIYNTNDLAKGIKRVFDDQKSYYVIGYTPEASTFDQRGGFDKFQRISVTVNRPGAVVRTRSGFYGVPQATAAVSSVRTAEQLAMAVVSPFVTNEIGVRLTSLFVNDAKAGSYLRSLLHINSNDLTFTERPDGWQEAVIEVMALTFGDNGNVVDQVSRRETVRARGQVYQRIRRDGLVYFLNMPMTKPGAYQFRIAVRDTKTRQIGSASQFVEIPNLRKKELALSGLVISGATRQGLKAAQTTDTVGRTDGKHEDNYEAESQSGAAVRRFKPGAMINYFLTIYNANLDKKTRRPKVDIQMRIFRERELVFASQQQEVELSRQTDFSRIVTGGEMQIGTGLPPGSYFLQAVVTDRLSKRDASISTQWIDFEIVR
ncbi:MAG TPA: VWA domain-containing protein [Pyrinomonadaceae bacterium]|nr:VWA domain-containing protein [Pyrinomonadaceae bacterium]